MPQLLFPASKSEALSVSEVRKCPSCATLKKNQKSRAHLRQLDQLFSLINNSILLSERRESALGLMNSAGRLLLSSLFFCTAIATLRSTASISSVLYCASEFFDQSTASVPEFAGILFRHP